MGDDLMRDMSLVVVTLASAATLLFDRAQPVRLTVAGIFSFVYLGVVASAGASMIFLVLLRRYPVSAISYQQFVTSALALLVGVLVGDEHIRSASAIGGIALLGGLGVLAHR